MKTKVIIIALILFMIACNSGVTEENKAPSEGLQSSKMILKASNDRYVIISEDAFLIANQPETIKAEVFEKIDLGNGKWALKASNGKFVTDDRQRGNSLAANRVAIGAWEQFEIISTKDSKISLKSSTGKIVCADMVQGGLLYANRDKANDWETFTVEQKPETSIP